MSEAPRIIVLGYDGAPTPTERALVAAADVVVGDKRHLDAFAVPPVARFTLGPLQPALERLTGLAEHERAVILDSGDPALFGIVRRLRSAGLQPMVRPRANAVATAFGRLGLPWEEAHIVSACGSELRRAINVVRAHAMVGVMTGPGAGIFEIAYALRPFWPRDLVLAERLGEADERVRRLSIEEALALDLDDVREPNVVLALAPEGEEPVPENPATQSPWRLGAPAVSEPAWHEVGLVDNHLGSLIAGALAVGPGDLALLGGWGLAAPFAQVPCTGAAALAWSWPRRWDEDSELLLDPDALYVGLVGVGDVEANITLLAQAIATAPRLRTIAVTLDGAPAAERLAQAVPQRAWTMLRVHPCEPIGPGAQRAWGEPGDAPHAQNSGEADLPPEVLAALADLEPNDLRLLVAGPPLDPDPAAPAAAQPGAQQ
ncbi:precorrin-6y C5,15-methyltransferase (decarboxylating) subunit CbiE [Gephyromycinifex aptenodytis]|uniref:precorrin-6y C5,15-methyltransferase (decarboxylating) subunit CbiE n=1 Tax=Gephyromycinifex aptenodytis TaxID=2716227 RepID=UPI0014476B20|nr:precorrin-6y C5,15-methyltransferase (decarboxylating) subunit CbiE [Gephyromycinifex aptenodytis]